MSINKKFLYTIIIVVCVSACFFLIIHINRQNKQDCHANCTNRHFSKDLPDVFKKDVKFVLVSEFRVDCFHMRYISGVKNMCKTLGIDLEVLDSPYDSDRILQYDKMSQYIDTSIAKQVDGIMINLGNEKLVAKKLQKCVKYNIPVVALSCDVNIPGITQIDQNDEMLADIVLKEMLKDIKSRGNIVYIWADDSTPLKKRNLAYIKILKENPFVKEIQRFGEISYTTALSTEAKMKTILNKYPKNNIQAVWSTCDEFAKGAVKAIKDANRDEIKVYSVDLSNDNIKMLQDKTNPLTAIVAVDPYYIGQTQVRILACKLAKIDIPQKYSFNPVLLTKNMLPPNKEITVDNLSEYIPAWKNSNDFYPDWMKELEK